MKHSLNFCNLIYRAVIHFTLKQLLHINKTIQKSQIKKENYLKKYQIKTKKIKNKNLTNNNIEQAEIKEWNKREIKILIKKG